MMMPGLKHARGPDGGFIAGPAFINVSIVFLNLFQNIIGKILAAALQAHRFHMLPVHRILRIALDDKVTLANRGKPDFPWSADSRD